MNLIEAHHAIAKAGLVAWTSGNASYRADKYMHIKPSGIACADITVSCPVRLADGRATIGLKPSTDTEAHRYIYNNRPEIHAIVHTHSTYVCAWAAIGDDPPVCLTEQADVFGDTLFVTSEYSTIGDASMGEALCKYDSSVHTVILRNHGLLATGPTLEKAVQRAIMAEHVCKSLAIARSMSDTLTPLSKMDVAWNYKRYSESYGQ